MLFRRAKTDLNDNAPAPPVLSNASVTAIGADAEFSGDLASSGDVRIEGSLRGSVRARRCVIEAEGIVEGQVIADEIIVRGRVDGPLKGYLVHLENGAQVRGDVVNERIIIDSGAELTGSVWRSDDPLGEGTAARDTAPEPASGSHFQVEHLWPEVDSGNYRPLAAVRPR